MTLTLPQDLIDEMIAHAQDDDPNECCGMIVRAPSGALTLYRTTNAAASPFRFQVQPEENLHLLFNVVDATDSDMLVIYHSHLKSEARPSPTDLRMARLYHTSDPWPYWVLVSLQDAEPSVRAWRIDGDIEDEELVPTEIGLDSGFLSQRARRIQLETVEAVAEGSRRRRQVREREL